MTSFRFGLPLAGMLVLGAIACRTQTSRVVTTSAELHTDYADLFSVLAPDDLERWVAVRRELRTALDAACAKEPCGGYPDVATVQLSCSASLARRTMHECAWIVGGSRDAIDGATGAHRGDVDAIVCTLPAADLSTTAFLDTLAAAGEAALDTPLPGGGPSLHDALATCLNGFDAGSPRPAAEPPGDFVAVEDLLPAGTKTGERWRAITRALPAVFDDACGDTFCEGDYGDISALHLACATERRTATVTTCTWTFAMATSDVAADGAIHAETATRTCPITVDAPAAALVAALAVDDPLHAALPGRATSLNDALIGCL